MERSHPFEKIKTIVALDELYEFDHERDNIGSGAFSVVYRALHRRTKQFVALKVLPKKRMDSDKSLKDVAREVRVLQSLNHNFVCGFVEAVQTNEVVAIAMTLVDGCVDLGSYLKKMQRLSESHAALIAAQVLKATDYLHSQRGVIHRDLKPENILLSDLDALLRETTPGDGKKACDSHREPTLADEGAPDFFSWGRATIVDFGFSRNVEAKGSASDSDPYCCTTESLGTKSGSSPTSKGDALLQANLLEEVTKTPKGQVPLSVPASPGLMFVTPQHTHEEPPEQCSPQVRLPPPDVEGMLTDHSVSQPRQNSEMLYTREVSIFERPSEKPSSSVFLSPCGSDRYLPLEMIRWLVDHGGEKMATTVDRACKLDCYSIGVVVYVMLSGNFPYNAKSRATLATQLANFPPKMNSPAWAGVSDDAKEFVRGLLKQDVDERLTISQALAHPWIRCEIDKLPKLTRDLLEKSSKLPSRPVSITPKSPSSKTSSDSDLTSHESSEQIFSNSSSHKETTKSV